MQRGLSSPLDDNFITAVDQYCTGNLVAISYFEVKQPSRLEYYCIKFIFYETQ